MKTDAELDARILAATERPALVRARRWKPRFDKLPICPQWDADVRHVLAWAERQRRRQGRQP